MSEINKKPTKRKSLAWIAGIATLGVLASGGTAAGMSIANFCKDGVGFVLSHAESSASDFNIDSNKNILLLNHDSTIYYTIPSDKTIASISIKVGDKTIYRDDDFVVEEDKIIIFARSMTSKHITFDVTLKATSAGTKTVKDIVVSQSGSLKNGEFLTQDHLGVIATIEDSGVTFQKRLNAKEGQSDGYEVYETNGSERGGLIGDFATRGREITPDEASKQSIKFWIEYTIGEGSKATSKHSIIEVKLEMKYSFYTLLTSVSKSSYIREEVIPFSDFIIQEQYACGSSAITKELVHSTDKSPTKKDGYYQVYYAKNDGVSWIPEDETSPISEAITVNDKMFKNGKIELVFTCSKDNKYYHQTILVDQKENRYVLNRLAITDLNDKEYSIDTTLTRSANNPFKASEIKVVPHFTDVYTSQDVPGAPVAFRGAKDSYSLVAIGKDYKEYQIENFDTVGINLNPDTYRLKFIYTYNGKTIEFESKLFIEIVKAKEYTTTLTYKGESLDENSQFVMPTTCSLKVDDVVVKAHCSSEEQTIPYGKLSGYRIYKCNDKSYTISEECANFNSVPITYSDDELKSNFTVRFYKIKYTLDGTEYEHNFKIVICHSNTISEATLSTIASTVAAGDVMKADTIKVGVNYYDYLNFGTKSELKNKLLTWSNEAANNCYRIWKSNGSGEKQKEYTDFDTSGYTLTSEDIAAGQTYFIIEFMLDDKLYNYEIALKLNQ